MAYRSLYEQNGRLEKEIRQFQEKVDSLVPVPTHTKEKQEVRMALKPKRESAVKQPI
jgi:hypothetical protein